MSERDHPSADEPPGTPTEILLAEFLEKALGQIQRGEAVNVEALLPTQPGLWVYARRLVADLQALRPPVATPGGAAVPPTVVPLPEEAPLPEPFPDPFPGEFRIRGMLGEGAFGKVWLAEEVRLGRQVALKTLRVPAESPEAAIVLVALEKDGKNLARVSHPNVVRVHAWRQAGEEHYLVLQYVAGGSLGAQVEREGPLPWQRAARYVADVGEGLLAVHAAGIVHRDVKPDNILWDAAKDEALLTDFGVSARLADRGTVAGTPVYMAPEAFRGRATAASDVYSLAATLFRLVTGQEPFTGQTKEEVLQKASQGLPEPDPRCAGMPQAVEQALRAGLAADAARRPPLRQFVDQLRGAFNQALADALAAPAATPGPAPVDLRLVVSRMVGADTWRPVAATHPLMEKLRRDMKKVPPRPGRVCLRTGERVRVEVVSDRAGYVTVFNVGPTGNLNLLYPEVPPTAGAAHDVEAGHPLHVLDVELEPPAGRERLVAVWSGEPLPLLAEQLHGLADRGVSGSRPYLASRDMVRLQEAVRQMRQGDCLSVVLELEHGAPV
jgi:serine/threonine protein kinase